MNDNTNDSTWFDKAIKRGEKLLIKQREMLVKYMFDKLFEELHKRHTK